LDKIKVGVVGAGHLGQHHLRIYSELPEAELIGIYDIDLTKAKEKSEEFKTTYFKKLDDLLEKSEAVSLVVPTSFHFSVAEEIIKNGVNLLIEKPITQTVNQAEKLIQMAKGKNLTLQVGVPRGIDVAVILDLMVHDIDLILSLVKDKVKTIEAAGVSVISDSEDIANARITFEKGCVANVTTSRISARAMRKLRLFQKDTYISMDFLKKKTEIYRLVESDKVKQQGKTVIGNIPLDKGKTILYEIPPVKDEDMLTSELKSFLEAVKDKKRPVVSGEDGKEALRVALEVVKKVKEHREKLR